MRATEAAGFGLSAPTRDPALFGVLVLLQTAVAYVGGLATAEPMAVYARAAARYADGGGEEASRDVAAAMAALAGEPAVFAFIGASLVMGVVVQTAFFRVLVRDQIGGLANIGFAADELRVGGAFVIATMLSFTGLLIGLGGAEVLQLVVGGLGAGAGAFAAGLGMAAALGLAAFVGVSFCAASAASFAEGRLAVVETLALTRGRVGVLAVAFVLLAILGGAVQLAGAVVMLGLSPNLAASSGVPPEEAAAALRTPGYLIAVLIQSAMALFWLAGWHGVGAYVVRVSAAAAPPPPEPE